jgi:hypothetical protein
MQLLEPIDVIGMALFNVFDPMSGILGAIYFIALFIRIEGFPNR